MLRGLTSGLYPIHLHPLGVCERKGILVDRCLKAEYDAKRDASVNKPKRHEKKKQQMIEDDEKKLNGDS